MTTVEASAEPVPRRNFWKSFLLGLKEDWLAYITFVVMVMALAGLMVAISGINQTNEQSRQLRRLVECQNSYNEVNNQRTRQLAAAADLENRAETEADRKLLGVVNVITQREQDPVAGTNAIKQLKTALAAQEKAREATARERLEHPVPPPPQALCGSVR